MHSHVLRLVMKMTVQCTVHVTSNVTGVFIGVGEVTGWTYLSRNRCTAAIRAKKITYYQIQWEPSSR